MTEQVIHIDRLSKYYRTGEIGTGFLYSEFTRWWAKKRGKPDPFKKINHDEINENQDDVVWALKGVSFSIDRGEIVGIIGDNGAGKSTLLKILSRITAPSSGTVKIKGRLASILEVGTGFHPDLTGRENVYLNAAINGLTIKEIDEKLDEIVEFSGVSDYIDTPVKRYSSGMSVRLAFSVAAHLDPDILIVDEVLAVGDADFQKKCIRKLEEAAKENRTIIYVSHNMSSVISLCERAILLENGTLASDGIPDKIVGQYLASSGQMSKYEKTGIGQNSIFSIETVRLLDQKGVEKSAYSNNEEVDVTILAKVSNGISGLQIFAEIYNELGDCLFTTTNQDAEDNKDHFSIGIYSFKFKIPLNIFRQGRYFIKIGALNPKFVQLDLVEPLLKFDVIEASRLPATFGQSRRGTISPILNWEIKKTELPST